MSEWVADEFAVDGLTVKIVNDEDPESPREWHNLGTIWGAHRRYALEDKGAGDPFSFTLDDARSWSEIDQRIRKQYPGAIVLEVWMYDHSGIRLDVEPFYGRAQHAEWDSGQFGVIYALPKQIREFFEVKRITPKIREQARLRLKSEIEAYDQYVSGDVWCYDVENDDGDQVETGCGYFGLDYAREAGREAAQEVLSTAA